VYRRPQAVPWQRLDLCYLETCSVVSERPSRNLIPGSGGRTARGRFTYAGHCATLVRDEGTLYSNPTSMFDSQSGHRTLG